MIEIENLTKKYKNLTALDNISLTIKSGELFAYLGPNGAGKTTTIRILTGLTKLTSGCARLNGFDIVHDELSAKRQYGLVPQSINLDRELSVYENLYIHGRLYHMSTKPLKKKIQELLNYVELSERRNTLVKKLSGGMKRRVMIACALVHSPVILFLDEPTVGLDPGMRRKVWALIKNIQQAGALIFLTTHYIEEAEFLAQRVAFIDEGKIVTVDTPENLIKQQGEWAIDRIVDGMMETVYFDSREDADNYNSCMDERFTFRKVNLEDSFLALTGKKVK